MPTQTKAQNMLCNFKLYWTLRRTIKPINKYNTGEPDEPRAANPSKLTLAHHTGLLSAIWTMNIPAAVTSIAQPRIVDNPSFIT
ncbi:MAG: hypothetical protein IPL71_19175 [Anaerolineales bacterium]|uniref:hypothetical protein n=1 Tax=Candidatus Villigracilis proximus TaxID=3140683 RepID=UPI003134B87E|nr:hypothetical protein [Anaerolineales bacterium]